MRQTIIREKSGVKLKDPILIEGLPGLGLVGKIVIEYLIKQLGARLFARLYSPFFPYHVLVNRKGNVRLLKSDFYYWKNNASKGNDLILLTGDTQAQTIEGQYDVTSKILDFAEDHSVKTIFTMGGYITPIQGAEQRVLGVATSPELLKKLVDAGVRISPAGNPIVGTAGLLVGLAKFRHIEASCLLGETAGYMPDPKAAKIVLRALLLILNIKVDLSDLDREIEEAGAVLKRMRSVEKKIESYEEAHRKAEKEKMTYIS